MRLILLTGARRGEVLNARWNQFDLEAAVWIKPAATTKQRCLHRAPISVSAAALLRTIRLRVPEDCEWVFPGEAQGKPLQDIKRFWEEVRTKAELPGVRIHDHRHTFAALLVSSGMTLPMISPASVSRWRQRKREEGEPRPKALGGDRRSGRIEAHHDAVLAALGPAKDATIEEVRHTLARQGLTFGFGTIQRFFVRHGITRKKRPPMPRSRTVPTS